MKRWKPPALHQPGDGYRFAIDAFLIAALAVRYTPQRWLDLGTGSGPIAWYLMQHLRESSGVAVERQPALAAYARRNLLGTGTCNPRVLLVEGDLRRIPWRDAYFDVVVTNPPFFPQGSGRLSPNKARAAAHHALYGDVVDFAASARHTLCDDGLFCCVLRLPDDQKLRAKLMHNGWALQREVRVHSKADKPPSRLLCAFGKHKTSHPVTSEQLVLHHADGEQTAALLDWLSPNL